MENVTVEKSVDKILADLNDKLTYTITLKNIGSSVAENIILTDSNPNLIFVQGSLKQNEIDDFYSDPTIGYSIGNLDSGNTVVVKFQMQINSLPNSKFISNSVSVVYNYGNNNEMITSNSVNTEIKNASVICTTTVDKNIAKISDVLTYSVAIENKGNVNASNVFFQDIIPENVSFKKESVTVNSEAKPLENPMSGIHIGNLNAKEKTIVDFQVIVNSIPNINPVVNCCKATYNYESEVSKAKESNESCVVTDVIYNHITLIQEHDEVKGKEGNNIVYNVTIINDGNLTATDINFKANIDGANFVDGTVKINGISKPDLNLTNGFNLQNIPPKSKFIVTFCANIQSVNVNVPFVLSYSVISCNFYLPLTKKVMSDVFQSNVDTIQLNSTIYPPYLIQYVYMLKIGEVIEIPVNIFTPNIKFENVIFKFPIPPQLQYVKNSFNIAGQYLSNDNLDLNKGVALGEITPGESYAIIFKVKVVGQLLSPINQLSSYVIISAQAQTNPPKNFQIGSKTIEFYCPRYELNVYKIFSKDTVQIGDIISCFIRIENSGNWYAENVKFKDCLPNNLRFIPKTVVINSIPNLTADPIAGIELGNIDICNTITISFNIKVESISLEDIVYSMAKATADFNILFKDSGFTKEFNSNVLAVNILK